MLIGEQAKKERREAYAEVLEILNNMDTKYVKKIPRELIDFFKRNELKEYKFKLDKTISFDKLELKQSTINILAMLNYNYWCEDEQHKKYLLEQYYKNELKYQEELRIKYNPDDIYKREKKIILDTNKQENNLLQYTNKQKWYKKIYIKIRECIKDILNIGKNV